MTPPKLSAAAYRLRPFERSDAPVVAELHRRAVEIIGARDYGPAQVAAWASRAPSAERVCARAEDGRLTLVAVDAADRPMAYADLEPDGHVDHLYCAPEAAGRGLASALCEALEAHARAKEIPRLYAEASEAARGVFESRGFTVTARREFEIGGAPIHNYAVEKRLG